MSDKNPQDLMSAILDEMNRVRELITEYESLPNNAGVLGAMFMKNTIGLSERAISSGNVVDMLVQYEELKSHTG